MEGQNIANILKYNKIHTKYIQIIYNTYKMAAAAMKDDLCAVIHADRKKLYADTSFVDSVRRLLEKEYDFRD